MLHVQTKSQSAENTVHTMGNKQYEVTKMFGT